MNLISYGRVSTDDKGQNPETQLLANRNYAAAYSHNIVAEFVDEGISGNTVFFDRPHGSEVNTLLSAKKADGIIVFAIDRFSRRNPFKVNDELEGMRTRGITFISVSEPFLNSDSEFREVVQFMITWFAHYFLKQHIKKVVAGMLRAAKQGTRSGKPIGKPPISGWHKNRIVELRGEGLSIRRIANELKLSIGSVHKTLAEKAANKVLETYGVHKEVLNEQKGG